MRCEFIKKISGSSSLSLWKKLLLLLKALDSSVWPCVFEALLVCEI